MRDTARQLADGVHLLRLDELAFQRPPLGDVGQRAGEFHCPSARVAEKHRLVVEMLVAAVGTAPAVLDRETAGRPAKGKGALDTLAIILVEAVGPQRRVLDDLARN